MFIFTWISVLMQLPEKQKQTEQLMDHQLKEEGHFLLSSSQCSPKHLCVLLDNFSIGLIKSYIQFLRTSAQPMLNCQSQTTSVIFYFTSTQLRCKTRVPSCIILFQFIQREFRNQRYVRSFGRLLQGIFNTVFCSILY